MPWQRGGEGVNQLIKQSTNQSINPPPTHPPTWTSASASRDAAMRSSTDRAPPSLSRFCCAHSLSRSRRNSSSARWKLMCTL